MKRIRVNKYASAIYRMSQQYYDRALQRHRIGCGQQFFLLEIVGTPGITVQELARKGHYDNGSATRATQKLEAEGYIRIEPDAKDRRIRRMYATDQASDLIRDTHEARDAWYEILLKGLTEEEIIQANDLMERMSKNAICYIKHEREDEDQ